ncbi:MAG: AAA family ATPase [Bacteroidales bacterium]|nr:AAA family ATPase [Bacteroidales bacterium]
MSGCIIGNFGFQRSGKTLLAYLIAEGYRKGEGIPVYSNMYVRDWVKIKSLTDLPFNHEPKVLLLDEAYYFMDSRNWQDNTESTIFFNTIGKQNILLIITAISPDMIEKRLRSQMNYVYLVKSDKNYIYYRMLDSVRKKYNDFSIKKCDELFSGLTYDTKQVPDIVDCSLKNFTDRVKEFYGKTETENLRRVKKL